MNENSDIIYDAIIIGGGIAGLTTAYMLRDKNILVLEKDWRSGGRVLSEKVHEATNNIGTQFFSDGNSSFADLLDELEIKRHSPDFKTTPLALYLNGKYYEDAKSYIDLKFIFQSIRMLFKSYRKYLITKLPHDDPRWVRLASQNTKELQKGMGKEILSLLNIFLRTTCLSKPERTSGIMGAMFMGSAAESGEIAFVKGGFQKITDAMVSILKDKLVYNGEVSSVEDIEGIVNVKYQQFGQDYHLKAHKVVVAAPAPDIPKFLPFISPSKKQALEKIKYGPITMVSIYLKRTIPWKRFFSLLSDNTFFQGVIDQTLGTEEDSNPDNPILYNFIISHYPDEIEEIEAFLAMSDRQIIRDVLDDFKSIIPEVQSIEDHITGSKVTRFPVGELELSPEYYLESLPFLQEPEGNIHFCGDYTEAQSFVDGAVISAFRVARELGSTYVVSEENEKKTAKIPRWGIWGITTIFINILLAFFGFMLPGLHGTVMTTGAALIFLTTLLLPYYFPPFKQLYKLMLGLSGSFGAVVALLTIL